MAIEDCEGYKKLLSTVENFGKKDPRFKEKLGWALERANHYAEVTGLRADDILTAWECKRNYSMLNYYQEANMPLLKNGKIRVFDAKDDLLASAGNKFRCPYCHGITENPYECDSGKIMKNKQPCDWKSYGLFRCLGKGAIVFMKDTMQIHEFFMPLAWEEEQKT